MHAYVPACLLACERSSKRAGLRTIVRVCVHERVCVCVRARVDARMGGACMRVLVCLCVRVCEQVITRSCVRARTHAFMRTKV